MALQGLIVDVTTHVTRVGQVNPVVCQRLRGHVVHLNLTATDDLRWVHSVLNRYIGLCAVARLHVELRLRRGPVRSSCCCNIRKLRLSSAQSVLRLAHLDLERGASGLLDNELLLECLNLIDLGLNAV